MQREEIVREPCVPVPPSVENKHWDLPKALSPGIAEATQIGRVSLDSPMANRLVESHFTAFPAEYRSGLHLSF